MGCKISHRNIARACDLVKGGESHLKNAPTAAYAEIARWILSLLTVFRRSHKVHLFGYRTTGLSFSALALGKSCSD
jgi:hypothetical protein